MTLTWNGSDYCYAYGDGRTLYVGGDDFAEEKLDRARMVFYEKHPELDRNTDEGFDAFAESSESNEILDEVFDDLTKVSEWEDNAVELEPGQTLMDADIPYHVMAWIESE